MDIRNCEICGQQFMAGYGYSLSLNWLVTGHAYVGAFICERTNGTGQHWGCSVEHALEAMQRCLNEHMRADVLLAKHAATEKPRYAEEDEHWAKGQGDNFHHVQILGALGGKFEGGK